MKATTKRGGCGRSWRGSALTEFGPAIGLILLFIFFPMLDLLSMLVSYGCCMVLNNAQTHEASLVHWNQAKSPAGPVRKAIPDGWKVSGFGKYVKVVGDVDTTVSYRKGENVADGVTDKIAMVSTTVTCSPFLPIPLPGANIPGLSGPMSFTISSERQMENPDFGEP